MSFSRPDLSGLVGKPFDTVPASCQRVLASATLGERLWVGPKEAAKLSKEDADAYAHAKTVMTHLAVRAPTAHQSGHPGGPLSSFTFAYFLSVRRDPAVDQPLRMSAGHLSLLSYGLQWMFGREGNDPHLASPHSIIESFRIPGGLPGHIEAGIGDIPFGTGPLGKGASHALGTAFGLKYLKKDGMVDVLLADGDAQEGQVMEAVRLAAHLKLDNLVVHGDWNDVQLSDLPTRTVAADFAGIVAAAGWNVIEVQNGNDPAQVVAAQNAADELKTSGRPTFICYYTTMGHGISFMEEGSNSGKENFHGSPLTKDQHEKALTEIPDFDAAITSYATYRKNFKARYEKGHVQTDIALEFSPKKSGYTRSITTEKGAARKDFGATHLLALMKADPRIVVLHADLAASGGFDKVQKSLPDRVINVGVAEANMYMMAAGMRQAGLLPVTYTFAAFGTGEARANARLIDINCGHTRCAVLHDCTHSGVSVGEDGETHQEQNYLTLPFRNTHVWMPGDSNQAAAMAERGMEMIAEGHTSVYVFSPRSGHPQILSPDGSPVYGNDYVFDGKADIVRGNGDSSDKVTIIASGITVHAAIAAADALRAQKDPVSVRVLNVGCIRPIDSAAILRAALETSHLITVEDHNVEGGLATQVADIIADFSVPCSLRRLGLTQYYPSGTDNDLYFIAGIDEESIHDAVLDEIRVEVTGGEEAFITCMYELQHNLNHSRFRETALPFAQALLHETGYLDSLRDAWKKRTCSPDRLPSTKDLQERLGSIFSL